tara:strand:+ start:47611 stop:47964 length:354 start_codon:yes stop_codon:yes gene_type:complete
MMKREASLGLSFMYAMIAIFIVSFAIVLLFFTEEGSTTVSITLIADLTIFRLIAYVIFTAGVWLWAKQKVKSAENSDLDEEAKFNHIELAQFYNQLWWKLIIGFTLYEVLFAQKLWM